MSKKPVIAIPCNVIDYRGSPGHIVRQTYVDAVLDYSGAIPLFLPASGAKVSFNDIRHVVDGVLLTGSPSHVAPACYGEEQVFDNSELDKDRDATTLPLISQVLAADIPLLAICRGFQELNVVTGGTLHQRVHELPGMQDHRAPKDRPPYEVYRMKAHNVTMQKGGLFEKFGLPEKFMTNTVHQQGVKTLGQGLFVEAKADDGLVEAISMPGKRFVLGTQWHPEGDPDDNPVSRKIFEKFGEALKK